MKLHKKLVLSLGALFVVAMPLFGVTSQFLGRAAAAANASWTDSSTISYQGVDYNDKGTQALAYNASPGKTYHVFATDLPSGGCLSEIYFDTSVDINTATSANLMAGQMGNGPSGSTGVCVGTTGGTVNFDKPLASATESGNGTDSGGNVDPCNATGDPLSWFICPVINAVSGAVDAMQGIINHLLEFDVSTVFDRNKASGQAYYNAWNSFRLVGIAVVVIAGLTMVIFQALGLEVFDAYTVRKTLPRLFIAAIGISLSWYLLQFLADFTNAVGLAVRNMIYWPFRDIGNGSTGLNGWSGLALGDVALVGLFAFLQIGGVLSLIATAGLAALIAFLVLIIRQMVLILLILLAPLAIALYVLPNTEKYYKIWWESISKGFMMFPIITAFIATGRVFSVVAANAGGGGVQGTINQVVSLIAYFLPYFALPFTFRLAGGAIATIGGLANDRSRGVFDRLRKGRAEKAAYNMERMKNQSRWDNNNWLGRQANKGATWATDPYSNAAYKLKDVKGAGIVGLRKKGYGVASAIEHARVDQSGKLFEEINKMGFNDKGLRALSGMHYGFSQPVREQLEKEGLYMKAPQSIKDVQKVADIMQQYGEGTTIIGGQALAANTGRLATLYQDPEMGKASIAAAGIMGLAAHGFADSRDLSNAANFLAGGKRVVATDNEGKSFDTVTTGHDVGFANAVIGQAQQLGSRSRPEAKNGYGIMIDSNGRFLDGMATEGTQGTYVENGQTVEIKGGGRMDAVMKTLDAHSVAGAKGGSIKAVRREIEARLNGDRGTNAVEKEAYRKTQEDQLFSWAGPYTAASQDVKVEALKIIDNMSGGRREYTREVEDRSGNRRTESYIGYAPGSIGERFERYARMEQNPALRGEGGAPEDPGATGGGGPQG